MAIDPSGAVYVVGQASCVRKIEGGEVSTYAGQCGNTGNDGDADGPLLDARFDWPRGITSTNDGRLLIADAGNNRLREISGGMVSTLAGSTPGFADGDAATAQFRSPTDIAVTGSGELIVSDLGNNRIRKLAP